MNEFEKAQSAKILACYGVDLQKGGFGSGKYQHKHGVSDTKKKSIAKNDILIDNVDTARKYPNGSIVKVSDRVARILAKTNLVGGKFVKEATVINDLGNGTYDIKIHNDNNINKSEENDLEKSEGSRGGKVIGHTKSGKPIYDTNVSHPVAGREGFHSDFVKNHEHFTSEDHSDAHDAHRKQVEHHGKEWEKHYNSVTGNEWNNDSSEKAKQAHKGTREASNQQNKHDKLADWHKEQAEKKKDNKVEKSEESDLEKGGEGSKGGKVIGHTSSGKPIYDKFSHASHKDFSVFEHSEAVDHHMKARKEANAKYHDTTDESERQKHKKVALHHTKQWEKHYDAINGGNE